MAPQRLQVARRRRRRRRLCVSKRLTISMTLAGITVSGFALWPGYMSMKYDRQTLAIAIWTARKEFMEYCEKLKAANDESSSKECLQAQEVGLPPPLADTRDGRTQQQDLSDRGDIERSMTPATATHSSAAVVIPMPTDGSKHIVPDLTPPATFVTPTTSSDRVESQSGVFVGYTSEFVYSSYTVWSCQPGQIWVSFGGHAGCACSGITFPTNCVGEMGTKGFPVVVKSILDFQCWPSWTSETWKWDATKLAVLASPCTYQPNRQIQASTSEAVIAKSPVFDSSTRRTNQVKSVESGNRGP